MLQGLHRVLKGFKISGRGAVRAFNSQHTTTTTTTATTTTNTTITTTAISTLKPETSRRRPKLERAWTSANSFQQDPKVNMPKSSTGFGDLG